MRTTIALAALAASTFSLAAESAEVYTYYCKGRVVAVRMENVNAMTGTIAVDGRVFSDAHLIPDTNWSDGCGYNSKATDKDGSTAFQGIARYRQVAHFKADHIEPRYLRELLLQVSEDVGRLRSKHG